MGHQCTGSGAPTPSPAPTTGCDGPFSEKDNGGTNMNNGGATASADACKLECEATDGCKGYTWKTDSSQCWLKSSVDEYVLTIFLPVAIAMEAAPSRSFVQ